MSRPGRIVSKDIYSIDAISISKFQISDHT